MDTERVVGYVCRVCSSAYPFLDNIPVLLPRSARNYELEYEAVATMAVSADPTFAESIRCTLELLIARKESSSWEWEDEAYWSEHYAEESSSTVRKNWNNRLWEREPLIDRLLFDQGTIEPRTILDIGCGDGGTFAALIAPHCAPGTVYVAADVSIEALRLNRSRNPHSNAVYVLCTAERLPFRAATFDVLCYWGILHHTEGKAKTLPGDSRLLKHGGYIVLQEALARPTVRDVFHLSAPEESAHEERIDVTDLLASVGSVRSLHPVLMRQYHTPIYTLAYWGRLGQWVMSKRHRFEFVSKLDRVLGRLGRVVPLFRPAALLMLVKYSPGSEV